MKIDDPFAITANLTDQQAHALDVGLHVQRPGVLTHWRLGTILTNNQRTVDPH